LSPLVHAEPEVLTAQLAVLSGPGAINCSAVDSAETLARAFSCAKEAIASSTAFSVVVHLSCADCSYWSAAAGSAEGALWEVTYDTNPTGSSSDTPKLVTKPCSALRFDPDGFPYILCAPKHVR
jgi:hypothetical protein